MRLHSPLNEEEFRDLISPVRMPVEFHTLFFIIRASTANQGKRKHMSFLSSVFIWQLIKAIFLFLISHFPWYWCDCLSVYFSTINPIVVLIYAVLCCSLPMVAQASNRIFLLLMEDSSCFQLSVQWTQTFLSWWHFIELTSWKGKFWAENKPALKLIK